MGWHTKLWWSPAVYPIRTSLPRRPATGRPDGTARPTAVRGSSWPWGRRRPRRPAPASPGGRRWSPTRPGCGPGRGRFPVGRRRGAATGTGNPRVIDRPVLQVQAPGHPTRFGMFFGASAIYQGIQYFHRKLNTKGLRGEVGPALTILRFLWSAVLRGSDFIPPVPISVAMDDNPPQQFDSLVVLVSTLERLFLGLYPYWGSESGPLHYTAVRARPRHLLRAIPSILRGRSGVHGTPENGFYSHNAHEIKLNLAGGFTLDGQLYTPESSEEPTVVRYGGTATFLGIS